MNATIFRSSAWLQWMNEYLFSLNLAWIIVWLERVRTKSLGGSFLERHVSNLLGGAYQLVSPIGGYTILEQLAWSFALSLVIFLLLRLVSGFALATSTLKAIVGPFAIAGFPLGALFLGLLYPDCCAEANVIALTIEVIFALTCGILFYLRKPLLSAISMTIVLALHFAIWGWVTSSFVNVRTLIDGLRHSDYYHPWSRVLAVLAFDLIFKFGFPILGFLSSVLWVRHITPLLERPTAVAAVPST